MVKIHGTSGKVMVRAWTANFTKATVRYVMTSASTKRIVPEMHDAPVRRAGRTGAS